MFTGIPVSPGIGIGRAILIAQDEIRVERRTVKDVAGEWRRFLDAVEVFAAEMSDASHIVSMNAGTAEADILSAQIAIVRDSDLHEEVRQLLEAEAVNAEYACCTVLTKYINLLTALHDEVMSARVADFQDIRRRILRILMGSSERDLRDVPPGSIIAGDDILPSSAAMLDPRKVLGIVTRFGTKYSHISIMARALGIPAVASASTAVLKTVEGDLLVVDGDIGVVEVNPSAKQLSLYESRQQKPPNLFPQLQQVRNQRTITADGKRVMLDVNMSFEQELDGIIANNADGIGLFRTEFIYLNANSLPGEETHLAIYKRLAQGMNGKPIIIRTADIRADSNIPCLTLVRERNPNMGYRAVRFSLGNLGIFKTQLAGILRAGIYGDVKVVFPVISNVSELRAAKAVLQEVKHELYDKGVCFRGEIPVGIVVETPAAAMSAEALAKECDFFSIGTNNLTQFTLAADRGNPYVAELYTPWHPAVLRLIHETVKGAAKSGIPVGVCGESASDPLMIPLLLGAGVDELSVSFDRIPAVRQQIADLHAGNWRQRFMEAMELETPDEVAHFVTLKIRYGQ